MTPRAEQGASSSMRSNGTPSHQRAGTPAANLECFPEQLIEERHQRCLEVIDRIAAKKRLDRVGTIHEVLVVSAEHMRPVDMTPRLRGQRNI